MQFPIVIQIDFDLSEDKKIKAFILTVFAMLAVAMMPWILEGVKTTTINALALACGAFQGGQGAQGYAKARGGG